MGQHSIKDASGHLHELVQRATQGETVVLTQDGKPVAEIKALDMGAKILSDEKLDWLDSIAVSATTSPISAVEIIRDIRSGWDR
jgi:antitoxin (DNA-binding transcriptional repressor) of toxin-antitoxin stability system